MTGDEASVKNHGRTTVFWCRKGTTTKKKGGRGLSVSDTGRGGGYTIAKDSVYKGVRKKSRGKATTIGGFSCEQPKKETGLRRRGGVS